MQRGVEVLPQNKCPEESELIAVNESCTAPKTFAHCKNHLHMMYHALEGYLTNNALGKHMNFFFN